ncbi:MAG: hypothetical protein IT445_11165 [Phycisphaeraceae bacterium]|nr:hypothetical protein [Phycisphaeraceae bacterium]
MKLTASCQRMGVQAIVRCRLSQQMSERENTIRAARFEGPDYIPISFIINPSCWHHYNQDDLQALMQEHPLLFPNFTRHQLVTPCYRLDQRANEPYTDPWGCVWESTENGITGTVVLHPLRNWRDFDGYRPPESKTTDGRLPIDWQRVKSDVERQRQNADLVSGGLPHGHTFLRLADIRGYENLIYDMLDEHPKLSFLIDMITEFNYEVIMKWVQLKPDMMRYPEDLGMQVGPMLSPDCFRKYIKPAYLRLLTPAREAGCVVHMHSDGDIRALTDDLIDCGIEVINVQDQVNGIEWLAAHLRGRVCIDLDIDRQGITTRGTPEQIDHLIYNAVKRLGSKNGGLMLVYGLYPNVPIQNVEAVMTAMEKYATYYS